MARKIKGEKIMDIKPVNQINFDYDGKHYCLEYTRDTVKQMEGAGFTINVQRITRCPAEFILVKT